MSLYAYNISDSVRIGTDEETRLYCLINKEENEVSLAVARKNSDNQFEVLAMTKPILSYKQFCDGERQMLYEPERHQAYFWYIADKLEIYLSFQENTPDIYVINRGEYREDEDIITFVPDRETNNRMIVAPLIWPQIKWPCNLLILQMDGFDLVHVLDVCREAMEYLNAYTDSHDFEDNSETLYEIIW